MSATEAEMRKVAREGPSKFWVGFSLVGLIGLCAFNQFLLLFIVPKFQQIFADAIPGMPLPPVTEFIITFRIALAVAIIAWPVSAVLFWRWQKPYLILWTDIGIVWFFLEIGITVIALFMPMTGGIITGMPDAK